jgi:RNA polymerase sigma-70 factor (ECF subfamily)
MVNAQIERRDFMERGELHNELVKYVGRKFASRSNISEMSGDIVNDVFLDFYVKHGNNSDKENFGYLSVSCVRRAYKIFKSWDINTSKISSLDDCLNFLTDTDVVDEIIQSEDTETVLNSLDTLKAIEKAIVLGRYYGNLQFSQIAENLGLNLSTVRSHHRRALEKLRPHLTKYFYIE